jgi:hypothetical protein
MADEQYVRCIGRAEDKAMNRTFLLGFALVSLVGCVTDQQRLDKQEPQAVETALKRARFEMNCPEATGRALSRELIQPAINAPRVGGVTRAEYTIGIEGCGKRTTSVVVCAIEGSGCFAAEGRR